MDPLSNSASSAPHRPLGQPSTPVRSISPLAPRSPLPGQERGYRPPHHHHPLPPPPAQQHDAWGPTSPGSTGAWRGPAPGGSAGGSSPPPPSPPPRHSATPAGVAGGVARDDLPSSRPGMEPRSPQTWGDAPRSRGRASGLQDDDDDDDDRALQRARPGSTTTTAQQQRLKAPVEGYVRIKVIGLDKNRRDIYVKFNAESNLPTYRNSTYRSVSRSYSECLKFAEALSVTCPQSILPALPLAQTSALTDDEDDRLVKQAFQKWFARVSNDPGVIKDDELRSFVESDFGYTPRPTSKRRSNAGGFLSSSRSSRLPGEQDDDLTLAKAGLAKLEHHLSETAKSIEKLSRARRQLAIATSDVGDQLATFSTVETYVPLAGGFKRLSRTHKSVSDVLIGQSGAEMVALGDSFGGQAMNARSAKETLAGRDSIVDEHRQAVKSTISKRRNIERLKSSSNIRAERVDEALDELDEAAKHEQLLAQRLAAISSNLAPSLRAHAKSTHEDLLNALIAHARVMTMYEKQVLKELELVRPELKAIKEVRSGVIYQGQVGPRMNAPGMTKGDGASTGTIRNGSTPTSPTAPSVRSGSTNGATSPTFGPGMQGHDPLLTATTRGSTTNSGGPAPVQKRTVRSMASSVVVENDKRQKVDARMAASMLANGF